mmetsp:Transcript_41528/g.72971  ORF Transcript_41528/g.72971 Transcript_41528/m.72971 type:complete len:185 (-) Transcript_41528:130-684(-)
MAFKAGGLPRGAKLPPLGGKIDRLMSEFRKVDRDKNGIISREELASHLNQDISDVNWQELLMVFDTDHDGKICYTEFVKMEAMIRCFRQADNDGNGKISRPELMLVLRTLDPGFPTRDLEELMASIDFDSSGCLSYVEFVMYVCDVSAKRAEEYHKVAEMLAEDMEKREEAIKKAEDFLGSPRK